MSHPYPEFAPDSLYSEPISGSPYDWMSAAGAAEFVYPERLQAHRFLEAFSEGDLPKAWTAAFDMLVGTEAPVVGQVYSYDQRPDPQDRAGQPTPREIHVWPFENLESILPKLGQSDGRYLDAAQIWHEEAEQGRQTSPRAIKAMQDALHVVGVFGWAYDNDRNAVGPMVIDRDFQGKALVFMGPEQSRLVESATYPLLREWGYAEPGQQPLLRWADENDGNGGEVVRGLLETDAIELSWEIATGWGIEGPSKINAFRALLGNVAIVRAHTGSEDPYSHEDRAPSIRRLALREIPEPLPLMAEPIKLAISSQYDTRDPDWPFNPGE